MKNARTSRTGLLCTSVLLLSIVGTAASALAQNVRANPKPGFAVQREIQGDFDRPLGQGTQDSVRTRTLMRLSQVENGTTYALTIEDGQNTASINGVPVPQDRIRERGGKVEILDPAGNVLTTFNVASINVDPFRLDNPRSIQAERGRRGAGDLNAFRLAPLHGVEQAAPPVMLGITMSAQDDGVVVDRVVPGLPAERAGLKEGDVILRFDDKPVASPEALRAALMDKKAGSQVTIRVKRDGKEVDLKAELTAFNAKELGVNDQAAMVVRPFMDQAEQSMDEAKRAVEEALEKIKAIDAEKIRKDVELALNKALAKVEAAQAGAREQGQRWVDMLNRGPGMRMLMGDGEQPQMFVMPEGANNQQLRDMIQEQLRMFENQNREFRRFNDGNARGMDDSARAMDRMSEQMQRMMDRLEQLEQRLNNAEKK